ncbi:MAG: hypothetical protein M1839_008253 [Geoglossum umbratile]|nr:MAG: hypothetical protein M1839_008253 [Geoglossum umbratile]
MSSMRNAIQRRNHRERAQPLERQKWGILEKHKDYSLRARDYNAKQARLKILREKAAERNPDEFYFGMMSSKTSRGGQIIADRGNKALSQDAVRLLKTQDAGYLRTMALVEGRKRRKLQAAVVMGEVGDRLSGGLSGGEKKIGGNHMVFVEGKEEQKAFDVQELSGAFGGDAKALGVKELHAEVETEDKGNAGKPVANRQSRKAIEKKQQAIKKEQAQRKKILRAQEARRKMLEVTMTRERELIMAERELELQRSRMGKTPTIGGTNKEGTKWKCRERKR